ncbi:hypothetical protein CCR75_005513 [Bremia lactucae]|uniref:Dihydrolipoamide acetyltransferase component of pyruvate dehydrogenase complex n=1 Tax=Bremia lactucae TaxID=4779 RepID=A0A976FGT5_BRELC|nr:hypothetical protein CCR75_005513 [Bremia lactucae]
MQRFQTALRPKTVWQRVVLLNAPSTVQREGSAAVIRRCFSALPDHEVVGLPALSPTMEVGTIAKWNKSEGDFISAGDVVCEVETDKAVVDYEATDDSYLAKILAPAGSSDIAVGKPIFVTVQEEADVTAFKSFSIDAVPAIDADPTALAIEAPAPGQPASPAPAPVSTVVSSSNRVFASPLARKIARDSGVLLSAINGSGPHGRVIKADVDEALAAADAATPSKSVDTALDAPRASTSSSTASHRDHVMSPEAQTLAEQLTQQKRDVPHYHLSTTLTLDKLLDVRTRLNAGRSSDEQLAVTDFLVRAASLAMQKVPAANASWKGSFIREYQDVNVNVIMSSRGGTVAPVLTQVNRKGLDAICHETQRVLEKATHGDLAPSDLENGTFTITNVGQFDVQSFAGIVRPDQACLLGLGTIEKKVVPNDDASAEKMYKYAHVMTATLACDHRVIDGAVGAQWVAVFKELVEDPLRMLL